MTLVCVQNDHGGTSEISFLSRVEKLSRKQAPSRAGMQSLLPGEIAQASGPRPPRWASYRRAVANHPQIPTDAEIRLRVKLREVAPRARAVWGKQTERKKKKRTERLNYRQNRRRTDAAIKVPSAPARK